MVVDKRGRYYAPMMLVVLYTTLLSLVVSITVKRHQAVVVEEVRMAIALDQMRWQSPVWGVIEEIRMLGVLDDECYISPYDELFVEICDLYGTDWRLLSAIAYVESRFRPYAESNTGALGIMQIMPRTAKIYGVPVETLSNPEVNIEVANLHLNEIERMLRMPKNMDERDRAAMILASYNGGVGRVFDAMRMARTDGEDPHLWSVVRRNLALLRLPHYAERKDVYCGRFPTPYTTIRYVEDVLAQYEIFLEITASCTAYLLPIGNGKHRH